MLKSLYDAEGEKVIRSREERRYLVWVTTEIYKK